MFTVSDHWTPFFEHLKEAWEKRHHSNLLFLFYEELSMVTWHATQKVFIPFQYKVQFYNL